MVKFFDRYHAGQVKVFNLCFESNRQYDPAHFGGRVASYPFKDHNAPPLAMIAPFCRDVADWLARDSRNVAAVHCKAGKGRTGVMIAAYLLHARVCETAADALATVARARTSDGKCVTIPSQHRFVHYYERLVREGDGCSPPPPAGGAPFERPTRPTYPYVLCSLKLLGVPQFFAYQRGCAPYFVLYGANPLDELLFDSREHFEVRRVRGRRGSEEVSFGSLEIYGIVLAGNVRLELWHQPSPGHAGTQMLHCWFHTAFIDKVRCAASARRGALPSSTRAR